MTPYDTLRAQANFALLRSLGHRWLWHHQDLNLQSPEDRVKAFLLCHSGSECNALIITTICQTVTMTWGIVIRVCIALSAVLHQEVRAVPGHAHNAI